MKIFVSVKRKLRLCNVNQIVCSAILFLLLIAYLLLRLSRHKNIHKPICWWPGFNMYEMELNEKFKKMETCSEGPTPLIKSNKTHLCPHFDIQNVTCSWISFHWKNRFNNRTDVEYNGKWRKLRKCTRIVQEFIEISCSQNNMVVYKDYRFFIQPVQPKQKNKWNVLVIGLEGLSRLNFRRQLPITKDAMFNGPFNTIEFDRFAAVSFDSIDQWLGLLSGGDCRKGSNFDRCDLIWKSLEQNGYNTAYGDDDPIDGTLRTINLGPAFKPVNNMFNVGLHRAMKISYKDGRCFGRNPSYRLLLNYAELFAKANTFRAHFGFFISSSWTKNRTFYLYDFDEALAEFVYMFADTKTVLIVLSDFGTFPNEMKYQYFWEKRMPALYFVLPHGFKRRYSTAYQNLISNKQQLITIYDLHKTIKNLLDIDDPEDSSGFNRMSRNSFSLFDFFLEERSCRDIGLAPDLCPCQSYKVLPSNDARLLLPTHFFISMLNRYNPHSCTFISPISIEHAYLSTFSLPNKKLYDFLLIIRTVPKGFIFKATVRCETCDADFQLILPVHAYTSTGQYVNCDNTDDSCSCPKITSDN